MAQSFAFVLLKCFTFISYYRGGMLRSIALIAVKFDKNEVVVNEVVSCITILPDMKVKEWKFSIKNATDRDDNITQFSYSIDQSQVKFMRPGGYITTCMAFDSDNLAAKSTTIIIVLQTIDNITVREGLEDSTLESWNMAYCLDNGRDINTSAIFHSEHSKKISCRHRVKYWFLNSVYIPIMIEFKLKQTPLIAKGKWNIELKYQFKKFQVEPVELFFDQEIFPEKNFILHESRQDLGTSSLYELHVSITYNTPGMLPAGRWQITRTNSASPWFSQQLEPYVQLKNASLSKTKVEVGEVITCLSQSQPPATDWQFNFYVLNKNTTISHYVSYRKNRVKFLKPGVYQLTCRALQFLPSADSTVFTATISKIIDVSEPENGEDMTSYSFTDISGSLTMYILVIVSIFIFFIFFASVGLYYMNLRRKRLMDQRTDALQNVLARSLSHAVNVDRLSITSSTSYGSGKSTDS